MNQGEFFASTHEDVFDRLTMIAQQQQEELSRAVKTSVSDTITPDQLLDSIRQSEQNAFAAAASASSSAASAAQSFDDFDDRYLGSKNADPTTDNDGQAIITGALYWNTPAGKMKAWSGSAWSFWSGDISGPASSTDTAIAIFDGASGKQVKGSSAKVNAAGDVISNGAQVGQSSTASNNFHWRNLLDGLLRLSRGNAGAPITDVMRVQADNSVEFPGGVASGVLGAGQTWQNVTGSRAVATTYTNSTGKPIQIAVACNTTIATSVTIAGTVVLSVGANSNQILLSYVVPAGATYRVDGVLVGGINWSELR